MVVYVDGTDEPRRYKPRLDFSICVYQYPRLVVEVCSDPYDYEDCWRMLVYGASIVRLANRILKGEGKPQNFALVAIYMLHSQADLYLLYKKDELSKVSHYSCDSE